MMPPGTRNAHRDRDVVKRAAKPTIRIRMLAEAAIIVSQQYHFRILHDAVHVTVAIEQRSRRLRIALGPV